MFKINCNEENNSKKWTEYLNAQTPPSQKGAQHQFVIREIQTKCMMFYNLLKCLK